MHPNREQRNLLREGVVAWGGPASCTDDIAHLLDYSSAGAFYADSDRLVRILESTEPLRALDLRRAILATELVFASYILGAAHDWSMVSGFDDEETLRILRGIQREHGLRALRV